MFNRFKGFNLDNFLEGKLAEDEAKKQQQHGPIEKSSATEKENQFRARRKTRDVVSVPGAKDARKSSERGAGARPDRTAHWRQCLPSRSTTISTDGTVSAEDQAKTLLRRALGNASQGPIASRGLQAGASTGYGPLDGQTRIDLFRSLRSNSDYGPPRLGRMSLDQTDPVPDSRIVQQERSSDTATTGLVPSQRTRAPEEHRCSTCGT